MESQTKPRSFLSAAAPLASSAMLAVGVIKTIFPRQLQTIVSSHLHALRTSLSSDHTILIHESESDNNYDSRLFLACKSYLGSIISSSASRFVASKNENNAAIIFSLEKGQVFFDLFDGVKFRWRLLDRETRRTVYINGQPMRVPEKIQFFELCFHKNHTQTAFGSYLRHVLKESDRIRASERSITIYVNANRRWVRQSPELLHPATFETLAMDSVLKQRIVEDLSRFSRNKESYKRRGKPLIRKYLLYGPSGTGKTSLIVAMSKFLRLDVYDLDIKALPSISAVKSLFLCMRKSSMLVVEDIDGLMNRSGRNVDKGGAFSLSALLNYVDRLWSSAGDDGEGRVVVFTAREKEGVDPAILLSGRIDVCFPMSYCEVSGFKILAWNHHGIDEHWRFGEIEGLLKEVEATPAEVGEQLMRSDDVDVALDELVQFLRRKKRVEADGEAGGSVTKQIYQRQAPAECGWHGEPPGRGFGGRRGGIRGSLVNMLYRGDRISERQWRGRGRGRGRR